MIPTDVITNWGESHPWSSREQIEQDFSLSQAICEIANNRVLGEELSFRGGTAFHKLFLPKPYRYSEDLDYVRSSEGGIGYILDQFTQIGIQLGYKVSTKIGKYPKVYWKTTSESGIPLRIKIEINTYERVSALPLTSIQHTINTPYYSTIADIKTYQVVELIATKIRALYQREKGRDLFDLWLALEILSISPIEIVEVFQKYKPEGFTQALAIGNLELKLRSNRFLSDLDNLSIPSEIYFYPINAGKLIIDKILSQL